MPRLARGRALRDGRAQPIGFAGILGRSPQLRAASTAPRALPRTGRHGAHRGRDRHRQGAAGAGHPLPQSARAPRPFVAVNCAAVPGQLLESELFGHERGAFTGARRRQAGAASSRPTAARSSSTRSASCRSTLQAKLLRVLEEREVARVGGQRTRDGGRARHRRHQRGPRGRRCARGEFREDLYYRLNVIALDAAAAARARGGRRAAGRALPRSAWRGSTGCPAPRSPRGAARRCAAHSWPGNVRELRNVIERALVLSPPGRAGRRRARGCRAAPPCPAPAHSLSGRPSHELVHARPLRDARADRGNKSEAARRLGISRSRLQRVLDGVMRPDGGDA